MSHRLDSTNARDFGISFLIVICAATCTGAAYSRTASSTPCLPATTTALESSRLVFQQFPANGPAETAWIVAWSENGHKGLWIQGAWFWRKAPFTSADAIQVLGRAGLSNIFVVYHSINPNPGYNPRLLDLGAGELLEAIPQDAGDCGAITDPVIPSPIAGRPARRVLIKEIRDRGVAWTSDRHTRRGEEMLLWATYDAGNYEYIMQYGFRDDGTITFRLGSTGYNSPVRPFEAHMHNALWYVDFNLATSTVGPEHNSVMLMKHFEPSDPANPNDPTDPNNPCLLNPSATFTASDCMRPFNNGVEGFADWNDKEFTHLNIRNTEVENAQGNNISYDLMPMRAGSARHVENFSQHDFWVTVAKSNEEDYAFGFENRDSPPPYITLLPESINDKDIAFWYMSSNHHLPRDEDHEYAQPVRLPGVALVMWSGFDLYPRNLFDDTPLHEPPCAMVPPGLVGWWPLDEISGATSVAALDDLGGSVVSNFGVPQPSAIGAANGPAPVPGVVGGALSFDGTDDYVEIPSSNALNFGAGDFSIDAWIKTTQDTGVAVILDKRQMSPYQGYHLFTSNGNLFLQLAAGGTYSNYPASAFVADGTWHHIAVAVNRTINKFTVRWYVDGKDTSLDPPSTPLTGTLDNAAPLRLGVRSFSLNGYWKGTLDELELFNRALTESEVFAIYDAGRVGKCSKP